jgi:Tol biopolymer transport system component
MHDSHRTVLLRRRAHHCPKACRRVVAGFAVFAASCGPRQAAVPPGSGAAEVASPVTIDANASGATASIVQPGARESHFGRLWQLTHGGQNAEAYFSADAGKLIFQGRRTGEVACDQIYTMDLNGANRRLVSTGRGRTTCGYFFPSGDRILYSSTHLAGADCPPEPDRSRGYVWPLNDYEIFTARTDGSDLRRLTASPGYDAEATISRDGKSIVFTSVRDGDLDLYVMDANGENVRRLTNDVGYDGGAFFSADGSKIVYRAHHPTDSATVADYRSLLTSGLVRPTRVEIMIMDADGSNKRQLTSSSQASFAPFFHPDGRRIIFSSNMHDPAGRSFSLYMIDVDGSSLERLTADVSFDGFPMFSPDGRLLVFASSRGAREPGEINLFIAEWVESPAR